GTPAGSMLFETLRTSSRTPSASLSQKRAPPPNSNDVPLSVSPPLGLMRALPTPANRNGPPERLLNGVNRTFPEKCENVASFGLSGVSSEVGVTPPASSTPHR